MNEMLNAIGLTVQEASDLNMNQNQGRSLRLEEVVRHKVLVQWNDTATCFPRTRCLHELVAEHAALAPSALALNLEGTWVTYGELDGCANQLANYLRTLRIGPEVVVGLCIERSPEMIIGMLGILKAGGAYLPLDKSDPPEHIAFLLEDAGVSVVLTSAETDAALAPHRVRTVKLDLDSEVISIQRKSAPISGAASDNLAYVMYTSGSSGKPKGVAVSHSNICRLVRNTNYVEITSKDVFLQLAPVSFDASTFEIWGALLNGALLVLYPPEPALDVLKLKSVIREAEVSIMWLTAGLFHAIGDGDLSVFAPIKQLLVGGDVVSAAHVRRILAGVPGCCVINGYGPTEGTTFSVCFPVCDPSSLDGSVPIGRPVSNTTVYVLDSELNPLPVGTPGELYIGGSGVSRGYFYRFDLTAESFVPNPFDNGGRLYRTGDIVRYIEGGVLEFVGRSDFQVKVRGYRIEPEEIEAALLLAPGVGQAAIAALPDAKGDKRLVAYIVSAEGGEADTKKLRDQLTQRLPEYMIPSVFIYLESLPLTANGKVDRKALPAPGVRAQRAISTTGIEESVAEIWISVLGVNEVELDDDFFELGGTSLSLINVVLEMSKRFGVPLETGIVLRGATVRALAQAVKEKLSEKQDPPVEKIVSEIWAKALGVDAGLDDDFFELGGTSLSLINVVLEMSKRFGVPLETGIVSRGATVRALAQGVKEKLSEKQDPPVEKVVSEIWAKTLGVDAGLDDDFFELGGTSLSLINVVLEMSKRFGVPLETGIVSRGATVRALAQAVKEKLLAPAHDAPHTSHNTASA